MKDQSSNKSIVFLSMVYISIMICSGLLVKKPVSMYFGHTTAATLIFPLWFVLNDVIAEVYGYKLCKKMLWTGFIVQLVFSLVCLGAIQIPSPPYWHDQAAFELILGHLFRITMATFVAFILGGLINIKLLVKWKMLMSGRYFWLRSIGSSTIGEAVYSVIAVYIILVGTMPLSKIAVIMFWSYVIKVIYTIVMAFPATVLVQILRKIEGIEPYGYQKNLELVKVKS